MYLYFLPLPLESDKRVLQEMPTEGERDEIQIPTSDGGIEVTAAEIRPSAEWLGMAGRGEIMLFPPQYMLLHLVSQHLDKQPRPDNSVEELGRRRRELIDFVHSGSTPWSEKCISPRMFKISSDGRAVLGLHNPGPELKGTNRTGELDRVVLVEFVKGVGPRNVEVKWKKDVLEEDREKSNL